MATPPELQFVKPDGEPKGLGGVFGGKKKYAEILAQAEAAFSRAHQVWQSEAAQVPVRQGQQDRAYEQLEQQPVTSLATARASYQAECRQRELEIQAVNEQLDLLIANLGYDVEEAVQEYVSIVLGNSVYPECFPIEHDFTFNSALRELTLTVLVPGPQDVPNTKEYRYVKAEDEITSTNLPVKEQKDRYSNAIAQVALRTLQEVFEADRAGKVSTIALSVETEAIDAATGRLRRTPLAVVAADRESFKTYDLANVVPLATLQHLGALVSKNPFDLVAIDTSKGVRKK